MLIEPARFIGRWDSPRSGLLADFAYCCASCNNVSKKRALHAGEETTLLQKILLKVQPASWRQTGPSR